MTETPSLDQFAIPASSAGGNLQWSRGLGAHHDLTAGADLFWTEGELDEDTRWVNGAFTRRRINGGEQLYRGVYVQDVFAPAENWNVVASGRLDFWRNYRGMRSERDLASGSLLIDTSYAAHAESRFSYSVGVRHDATPRLAWRSSIHTAFRAPTLNELYKAARESGNVTIEANPDLSAERLLGAELGADYAFSDVGVARLTGFWSRLTTPIVDATIGRATGGTQNIPPCGAITAGGTCRQRRNLGAGRTYGVEAELELRPLPQWGLTGSYVWNPTEVTESPGQPEALGKATRGVPEHAVTARADYASARLGSLALTARWIGRRYEDDLNTLVLDPFFVLDARLARRVGTHWEVFGGVENLLGDEYVISRTANGRIRIGAPRLMQAGVRARW
jgi:outer membrane receptor protein involved in Fe transport